MSHKPFIDNVKPEFEKAFKFLEGQLDKMRTGRANPSLVEDIQVNCFGSMMPLKQLAAISSPEPNQIVIQPWDQSYIEPIQNAISNSGLGMSATVDKNLIRLGLPLMTEEHRKNMVKILNGKAEEARQTLRHFREDAWNKMQQAQKDKKITEDDKFRGKDELQKLMDEYQDKIKKLVERKEQELL